MHRRLEGFVSLLENVDSRLIVITIILFAAIIFALYKGVSALTSSSAKPAYQNTPSQAFVPPASSVLVDPTYLTQPRLPDGDLVAILSSAEDLMTPTAQLTVSQAQLEKAGMTAYAAQQTILALQGQAGNLQGRQVSVQTNSIQVSPGADQNSASVQVPVDYSQSSSGAPPVQATEDFSYTRASDNYASSLYKVWQLQALILNVSTGASLPGGSVSTPTGGSPVVVPGSTGPGTSAGG